MQKILFIYFLNTKQKENNQTPSKVLNVALSIMIILIALIFSGKQMIGFLSAEPINGKDILGSLLLIYGTLNLIHSYAIDYEVHSAKLKVFALGEKSFEAIVVKKSNKELNILQMVSYAELELLKKEDQKHNTKTIKEKKEILISTPALKKREEIEPNPIEVTPDEILLEQLRDMEENFYLYEESVQIDENALPPPSLDNEPFAATKLSKEEKLTSFLTDLL